MSHIFCRVIQEEYLTKVLQSLLEEDIPEMHTVSLEDTSLKAAVPRADRKSKYTLEELSQWTSEDWELEIQLAP